MACSECKYIDNKGGAYYCTKQNAFVGNPDNYSCKEYADSIDVDFNEIELNNISKEDIRISKEDFEKYAKVYKKIFDAEQDIENLQNLSEYLLSLSTDSIYILINDDEKYYVNAGLRLLIANAITKYIKHTQREISKQVEGYGIQ